MSPYRTNAQPPPKKKPGFFKSLFKKSPVWEMKCKYYFQTGLDDANHWLRHLHLTKIVDGQSETFYFVGNALDGWYQEMYGDFVFIGDSFQGLDLGLSWCTNQIHKK